MALVALALGPLCGALAVVETTDRRARRVALDERADRLGDAWRAHLDEVLRAGEDDLARRCDAPGLVAWRIEGGALEGRAACGERRRIPLADVVRTAPGADAVRVGLESGPAPRGRIRRVLRTFPGDGPSTRLVLDVASPRTDGSSADERALGLSLVVGAALLGAVGLAWLAARRVRAPLSELEAAATRIARGDRGVQLEGAPSDASTTFSAFNRMARELRDAEARARRAERVAAWRDIARRIAHEVKNPLTPIRTSIETMRRTKARAHPEFDEIFEESTITVLEEVARLERIVTEFSRFARLPRPAPVDVDLARLAAQAVQLHDAHGHRLEEPGRTGADEADTGHPGPVSFTLDLPGAPVMVRADRDQLMQVLVNLVQNAVDACQSIPGRRGRVLVRVRATDDGGGRLVVGDDGPGIAPEERARVLDPYVTTKPGGTGLGLAVVDRIVSEHGGTLEVGASPLGGAELAVTWTRQGPVHDPGSSRA